MSKPIPDGCRRCATSYARDALAKMREDEDMIASLVNRLLEATDARIDDKRDVITVREELIAARMEIAALRARIAQEASDGEKN